MSQPKRLSRSPSIVRSCFHDLCKRFATPLSLNAIALDDLEISKLSLDPALYHDVSTFRKDLFVVSFLSKYKGLDITVDTKKEAIHKFNLMEEKCNTTNARIQGNNDLPNAILFESARIISKILGPFSYSKVISHCGWGPGSTFDLRRGKNQVDLKVSKLPLTVTDSALPFFERVLKDDLHWSSVILAVPPSDIQRPFSFIRDRVFDIVDGSKLTTVPKNARTDRVIAIEPTANMFLQKGAGYFMRSKLKSVSGIDLNDQSINQMGAKRAYDYALSTLDLSSASDTVATELVNALLPTDWFNYLNAIRSKSYLLDNSWYKYHKFSSMGNGFTFELESLIFYALSESVRRRTTRREESTLVYGDDIIVPRESAHYVSNVLTSCGFTLNSDKSFIDGFYFESCGKHFFKGVDVTPIYQKEIPDGDIMETIRLCNRIIRCSLRWGDYSYCHNYFKSSWRRLFRSAKTSFRIPLGSEGDDAFVAPRSFYFSGLEKVRTDINYGIKCNVYVQRPVKVPAHSSALLALTLRQRSINLSSYELEFNDTVDSKRFNVIRSSRWVMPTEVFALDWN